MTPTQTQERLNHVDHHDKFVWQVPTRVTFGRGSRYSIGTEAAALGSAPALVVDSGIGSDARISDLVRSLATHHVPVTDVTYVEINPTLDAVVEASNAIAEAGSDTVVGIGGGSTMDAAKLAALMVTNPHLRRPEMWEASALLDLDAENAVDLRPGLPTLILPSTAATGSELNSVAAVRHEGRRRLLVSGRLAPTSALLDPELLSTVPREALLEGGIETLVRLLSPFLLESGALAVTDSLALSLASQCLQRMKDISSTTYVDSNARDELMWTVSMSATQLCALGRGRWSHVLWYLQDSVCSLQRITKGRAIAALLPSYLREIRTGSQLGQRMGSLQRLEMLEAELAPTLQLGPDVPLEDVLAGLCAEWGLPSDLSELVSENSELDAFARHCYEGWHGQGQLKGVSEEELIDFFRRSSTAGCQE